MIDGSEKVDGDVVLFDRRGDEQIQNRLGFDWIREYDGAVLQFKTLSEEKHLATCERNPPENDRIGKGVGYCPIRRAGDAELAIREAKFVRGLNSNVQFRVGREGRGCAVGWRTGKLPDDSG